MRAPSVRVGRNRRRTFLYTPCLPSRRAALPDSRRLIPRYQLRLHRRRHLPHRGRRRIHHRDRTEKMTEQPVETEQQFLGNETPDPVQGVLADISAGVVPIAVARQHYVPNAHLRRPAWSVVDDVQLAALARKASHAAKVLAIAKAESVRAEEALKHALDVENEAAARLHEAESALRDLTRKDSGL